MSFQVDLDPSHSVIRVTVFDEAVSLECAQSIYEHLSRIASTGGPYSAIYDLSMAKSTSIPTDFVRDFARRQPAIPTGRAQVIVGKETVIYGLARLFQLCSESVGQPFEVVHSLKEAYNMVGEHPEDFTERLYPKDRAA